jgi:predicted component of type VI protein secretion system
MQLRLGFELDASVTRSKGEALINLNFSAVNGQAVVTVRNIKIDSSNVVLDVASRMLSQPLRDMLAQQLTQAINEAIADLPNQVSALKKVEIMDVRN